MNTNASKTFVHDNLNDPAGQRGVDRCYHMFTSALTKEFPGQVLIYSNRIDDFPGGKILRPPSQYFGKLFPVKVNKILDNLEGDLIANRYAKIYYSPFYGMIKTKIPQIYTAHDMIFERFPNYFSSNAQKRFIKQKRNCFERAELILCVSRSTADDIKEFYPELSSHKIKYIYNGINDIFFCESSEISHYNSTAVKPYFLYVGNRLFYKNFTRFLIAYGESNLASQLQLKIISPKADFPTLEESEIIEKYHLTDNIHVEISIPDSLLKERYQNAFAFVFPSEYEGFGLPLMEAMACGTLTLASNVSSLPEIGGDVPLYFNPTSVDSIKDGLLKVCSLPDRDRLERIEKGKIRAKYFTWESSQKAFLHEIKSLL
jgi:glycosyltransferase involved in cell wall biosynthesis